MKDVIQVSFTTIGAIVLVKKLTVFVFPQQVHGDIEALVDILHV